MTSRTRIPAKNPVSPSPKTNPEQLHKELAAVTEQRQEDHARLKLLTQECEMLRQELARRNAEEHKSGSKTGGLIDDEPEIEGWQLLPAAARSVERKEQPVSGSLFDRLVAALLLRLARKAAKRQDYARAEIFYQAILQLRPRAFLWRQTGNMLAGQGLFTAAIDCFDRVIAATPEDGEAHLSRSNALRALHRNQEASESLRLALALNPALQQRAHN